MSRYQDIFHTEQQPDAYVHINELGSRCYLSLAPTDTTMQLYRSENLEKHWTQPQQLKGINDDAQFPRVNYPFMMGDGQTLYFAAEGGDGLGGYDIYVTRYNAEENQFLHPVNIGMPFNSEANDYFYIVDEYSHLGWFATDRNQPADTVCVYLFVPPTARTTYSASGFSPEEIAPFARIARIADTWTDDEARQDALARLNAVTQRQHEKPVEQEFAFVINDATTYTRLADFRAPGNLEQFLQLQDLRRQYQQLVNSLDTAREQYAQAGNAERGKLRPAILASEQQQYALRQEINNTEKAIRNNEIIFLTNPESELIINGDGSCFHLHLKPEFLADKVILVGDPARVNTVAAHFDSIEHEVSSREFHTITGMYKGKRITCQSHGIGCDNIDIVVNELDTLANIDYATREEKPEHRALTMVRIGTCGGLQPFTPTGSFIASVKSIGFDGLLNFYAGRNDVCDLKHMDWNPIKGAPYVAVADRELIDRIAADDMVKGYTVACGGFYGPQGRQLRAAVGDPEQNKKIEAFEYEGMKICNFEMESSALAGLAALLGHHAMTCCMVIANRYAQKMNTDYKNSIDTIIQKVLDRI